MQRGAVAVKYEQTCWHAVQEVEDGGGRDGEGGEGGGAREGGGGEQLLCELRQLLVPGHEFWV